MKCQECGARRCGARRCTGADRKPGTAGPRELLRRLRVCEPAVWPARREQHHVVILVQKKGPVAARSGQHVVILVRNKEKAKGLDGERRFGRLLGHFPPGMAWGLLLIALAAAIA